MAEKPYEVKEKTEYFFPIYKCDTVRETMELLKKKLGDRKALFVLDREYDELINNRLSDTVKEFFDEESNGIISLYPRKNGCENKDHESLFMILDKLIDMDLPRDGVIVGIGGGVITDIAGFAARQFRRMVDFVRVPTTLLGQIDASVGIKVGINYNGNKNILGAFYAPLFVINCREFLYDLDDINFNSGISEMLKAGIVESSVIIDGLRERRYNAPLLRNDAFAMESFDIITDESVDVMKRIIMDDPEEKSFGVRSMDLGHTFSLSYEAISGYKMPHGYAVAAEVVICAYISRALGLLSLEEMRVYEKIFLKYDLLKYYDMIYPEIKEIFDKTVDKIVSHRAGNLNLVLPESGCKASFCNLFGTKDENRAGCRVLLTKDELRSLYCGGADMANELAKGKYRNKALR
ncbi:MAG: sedoheptulose 7-phosphate cyclase [Ruminococcaceae bacterium]|nr:sedoheptulose 7-phosphate cyclase [Oscillospiraceae bacterium]